MSLAKLLRRALQSTDWGLVFYLGVLVCLAVYVVSVAVQGYRRRKAHRAQVEARRGAHAVQTFPCAHKSSCQPSPRCPSIA